MSANTTSNTTKMDPAIRERASEIYYSMWAITWPDSIRAALFEKEYGGYELDRALNMLGFAKDGFDEAVSMVKQNDILVSRYAYWDHGNRHD